MNTKEKYTEIGMDKESCPQQQPEKQEVVEAEQNVAVENCQTEVCPQMDEEEIKACKKLLDEQKANIKKRKIPINSLIIVGVILAIITAIVLVVWWKKDPLEKLVKFDDTADAAETLCIMFFSIAGLWFALDEMKGVIYACLGNNVLKHKNADFKSYAKQTKGTLNEADLNALNSYLLAQYWIEKPQDKKMEIAKSAICAVADLFGCAVLGLVIANGIRDSMLENKFTFDNSLIDTYLGVLIAAFIIWVIADVIKIIFTATVKKRVKAWTDKVFGD